MSADTLGPDSAKLARGRAVAAREPTAYGLARFKRRYAHDLRDERILLAMFVGFTLGLERGAPSCELFEEAW